MYDADAPLLDAPVLDTPVPFLGICYGMGVLHQLAGADIGQADRREFGAAQLFVDDTSDLFCGFSASDPTTSPG